MDATWDQGFLEVEGMSARYDGMIMPNEDDLDSVACSLLRIIVTVAMPCSLNLHFARAKTWWR